jgi:hypothetical protein
MANGFVGWPNRTTEGSASVSGGSWLAALPAANVLSREMTDVARSNGLGSVVLDFDFGSPVARTLQAFALGNHNISRGGTWRIQMGDTPGGAEVFDSEEIAVWRLDFDTGEPDWGENNWWEGNYDDEYVGHPFSALYFAPQQYASRYLRITIYDDYNLNGYVQLGRVFAGIGIQFEYDRMSTATSGWESLSQVETSRNGTDYYEENRAYRVEQFSVDWISAGSPFRQYYEMQRRLGVTGEVLWMPDPDDLEASQLTGGFFRMRQLAPFEYPMFDSRRAAFDLKEII